MPTTWTAARLAHACDVLATKRSVESAATRLGDDWAEDVTPAAMRAAFLRHGLPSPGTYAAGERMLKQDLLEDDDGPTDKTAWVPQISPRAYEPPAEMAQIVGLLPDIHAPYHDVQALRIALNALDHVGVDVVAQLGDLIDNYVVGKHGDVDFAKAKPLKYEIEEASRVREQIEALGAKRQIMIEGNHETRLMRLVMADAPVLLDIVPTIKQLLGFDSPSWEWHPYGTSTKIGRLNLTHCIDGRAGPTEHMRARADYEGNVAIGHTHRAGIHYAGNAQGETRVGAMLGWLGDKSAIKYVSQVKANRYWQHGFGLAYLEPDGNIHLHFVPVVDGRAVVHGRVIRA